MDYFITQVIGNDGQILDSKRVLVPQRDYHVFAFPLTYEHLPSAKVFVHYYEGHHMVFDQADIEVDTARIHLNQNIDVKIAPNVAMPGQSVNISVASSPSSFVALTGVDLSVLLLNKNDDFSVSNIVSDLGNYHSKSYRYSFEVSNVNMIILSRLLISFSFEESWCYSFFECQGKSTPHCVSCSRRIVCAFSRFFLFFYIFLYFSNNSRPFVLNDPVREYAFQSSGAQGASHAYPTTTAPHYEYSQASNVQVQVRKHFPETWLWESIYGDE